MESPTTVTTQNAIDSIIWRSHRKFFTTKLGKVKCNRYSLSPKQEIHFKGSKVRDENGNLIAPTKDGDIRYSLSGGLEKTGKYYTMIIIR